MIVVLRCSASPEIGGGHVARCIGLAEAFAADGHQPLFAVSGQTLESAPSLRASPYPWFVIDDPTALGSSLPIDRGGIADIIVFDLHGVGRDEERAARNAARRIVVIDDLADRPHDCDALINSSGAATPRDYQQLVPALCLLLLGPRYAPVAPRFRALRPTSLARRAQSRSVGNILVSFGLTDPVNATCRALAALQPVAPPAVVVAIGAGAPYLPAVRAACEGWAELDVDSTRMAELMASADIALGAAGSSSWERCCLGLPSVAVTIAEDQRGIANMLAQSGASVTLTFADASVEAIRSAVAALLADGDRRRRMADAAASLCDGDGARRVVKALTR